MHGAPSVLYPVGRSRFALLLAVSLWVGAACCTGLWLYQPVEPGWRQAAALVALATSALVALGAWFRSPRGELRWDGRAWYWSGAAGTGSVAVVLDLQRVMLLAWLKGGNERPLWLWLERPASPQRWQGLRRAVYSPASTDAPPQAPTAANP